jgi:phage terminase large subunit-like protein
MSDRQQLEKTAQAVKTLTDNIRYNRLDYTFSEQGKYTRDLYPKHLDFFKAGKRYVERAFIAGNRTGKTHAGVYEMVLHLTGLYPDWWEGRRYDRPIAAWICGDRGEIMRDSIQRLLIGSMTDPGTGLIPKQVIDKTKTHMQPGVPGFIAHMDIPHVSGSYSTMAFKTYKSGQEAFEAAAVDVIMCDEECPYDIYQECLMRILSTKGMIYLTFTPDSGLTETVLHFFKDGSFEAGAASGKYVCMVSWNDVPHLDEETKKILLESIPPHARDARTKGIPWLGSGAVFPVVWDEIFIDPFPIPDYWARCYGLDVGWNHPTAAVWIAYCQETDTVYIYDEYKRAQEKPEVHAAAIKSRGAWIPGVIDPASAGSSQYDGKRVIDGYIGQGLNLFFADNSLDAGIMELLSRFSTGRLKIFKTCQNLQHELRLYRYDKHGKVVKQLDDAICATRYGVMSGLTIARPEYLDDLPQQNLLKRNKVTGY